MDEEISPPSVEISRGLKEVIVWRYVAEMIRRYPHRLWVCQAEKETWDEQSQPNLLRVAIAFPEFDGRYADFDLLEGDTYRFHTPQYSSEMPRVWEMAVKHHDLKELLNHLVADVGLDSYQAGQMPSTSPATLVYRVMAAVSAATVFHHHAWRWVNSVRLNEEWLGATLRTELIRSFPTLDIPEPRYSEIGNARSDPAYGYWMLTLDSDPVVCLSMDGRAHFPDRRELDLMSIYDETRTRGAAGRVGPVVHALGQDFLP